IAEKINAVNPNDVVKSVLRTHLLPDIIGNTKAYTSQRFRCKDCSAKYRRMPIMGVCLTCGGELQASVTRGSVEKYLQLGLRLSAKYDVGEYMRSRFVLASEELATLFKPEGHQSDINDYFNGINQISETRIENVSSNIARTANINGLATDDSETTSKIEKKKSKPVEQFQTTLFENRNTSGVQANV
ncbi:MAG: hypothetical protein ACYCPW_10155, partial [Nitrososphaerales archaeon]